MTTRTFANKEELMIALLKGEKWKKYLDSDNYCYYDGDTDYPFRIRYFNSSCKIDGIWELCDGKTLWHKVEEKTELDLMKKEN